jgi:tetratricopeptide (TPR) repeat protein
MKIVASSIFLLFVLFANGTQAQTEHFNFNSRFYDAIDEYVLFPNSDNDGSNLTGFIYIDQMAGVTFRLLGSIKVDKDQLTFDESDQNGITMMRLESNTSNVHILTEKQRRELNLKEIPDWLEVYKRGSGTGQYLKDIGFHLNHIGGSSAALKPLLKAYEIDPKIEGLDFEIAYAYNATEKYDKAISFITKALKQNPNDSMLYRELGYAYIHIEDIKLAEKTYLIGIDKAQENFQKAEMSINMTQVYFNLRNKEKFDQWSERTLSFIDENSEYNKYIAYFKAEWDKSTK